MANNMLLPALPDIQQQFQADLPAAQTTVSFYLLAFAVGILFVGPLSDRYGRRPIIIGGLLLFMFGALIAALAPTLAWLVAGRIVQALGAAAGVTVARAVAGDHFHGSALAQTLATVTMAMVLGTSLAPVLGGYLVTWFSWHAGFWVMVAVAAIVLACAWFLLPETRARSSRPETAHELAREAALVLRNPRFVGYALQSGLIYALFLGFISVTPHVVVDAYGGDATDFGIYYLLLSGGYFVGNFFVASAGRGMPAERVMFVGLWIQFAGAGLGVMLAFIGPWTPMALFLPQLPLSFGQGLALPHVVARAVRLAPEYPGVASSVIGFAQQATAALAVQLMGLFATDTPVPVTVFCAICAAVALFALLRLTPDPAR